MKVFYSHRAFAVNIKFQECWFARYPWIWQLFRYKTQILIVWIWKICLTISPHNTCNFIYLFGFRLTIYEDYEVEKYVEKIKFIHFSRISNTGFNLNYLIFSI